MELPGYRRERWYRLWLATYNKDLIYLNQETESRMEDTGQASSNIDLIFGTTEMVNIVECEQVMDTWGSDHHPIEIRMEVKVQTYRKKSNRISTKKNKMERIPQRN
ncbi:hypothetical protein RF55_14298 [Lasius niger]|uniref:Uncharacterized protein n=1 Tax=Lasius niger TaxID=67767 RepID=A0A0J7K8B1_LASNI|nr:hypothetical protein RF55_14298 [Lasius niger]